MTQEEKLILTVQDVFKRRFKTFKSANNKYYLYTDKHMNYYNGLSYLFDNERKEFTVVRITTVKKVIAFFGFKSKMKDIECDIKEEFLDMNSTDRYYFYMTEVYSKQLNETIPAPYKPFGYDIFASCGMTYATIYREFLDQIFNVEQGCVPVSDIDGDPFYVSPPFTSYANYYALSLLIENKSMLKIVNIKDASKYLLFRIIVDERTETYKIDAPDKYKGIDLSEFSKIKLLIWLFENCEFVPVTIKKETFMPNGKSHMWSHIKNDKELMDKLQHYLENVKHEPNDNVYYNIRVTSCGNYCLERDIIMSPRKPRRKRTKTTKERGKKKC